jgi:hypothetical protein
MQPVRGAEEEEVEMGICNDGNLAAQLQALGRIDTDVLSTVSPYEDQLRALGPTRSELDVHRIDDCFRIAGARALVDYAGVFRSNGWCHQRNSLNLNEPGRIFNSHFRLELPFGP